MGSFYGWRIGQAALKLETTAGTLLPATHAFLSPTQSRWLQTQTGSDGQPVWRPSSTVAPEPDSGFTGYYVGSTAVYTDGSLPASGSNTQLLVANPASTFVFRGVPTIQVIAEPSNDMQVMVRLVQYVATVVRYPASAAVISGNAYPSAPTWA